MRKVLLSIFIISQVILLLAGCSGTPKPICDYKMSKQEYKKYKKMDKEISMIQHNEIFNKSRFYFWKKVKTDYEIKYEDKSGFFNLNISSARYRFSLPSLRISDEYLADIYYLRPIEYHNSTSVYPHFLRKHFSLTQNGKCSWTINKTKPVKFKNKYYVPIAVNGYDSIISSKLKMVFGRTAKIHAMVAKEYLEGYTYKDEHNKIYKVHGIREVGKIYDEFLNEYVLSTMYLAGKYYNSGHYLRANEVDGKIFTYKVDGPSNNLHLVPFKPTKIPINITIKDVTFTHPFISFKAKDKNLIISYNQKTSSFEFYNKTQKFISIKNVSLYYKGIIYKLNLHELQNGVPPEGTIIAKLPKVDGDIAIKNMTVKKAVKQLPIRYGLAVQYSFEDTLHTIYSVKKYNFLQYLKQL